MKRRPWSESITRHMQQYGQALQLQPILELGGDKRIWIENHGGVKDYSPNHICVTVRYGQIMIYGVDLCMRKMQGQILVITGRIDRIELMRGDG